MPTQYEHTLKTLQQGANRHGRRLVVAGLLVVLLLLLVWQAGEQVTIRDREFSRLSTQSGIISHDLRRQLMSIRALHVNLQAELLSGAKTFESVRPFIDKRLSAFVQTVNGVRTVLCWMPRHQFWLAATRNSKRVTAWPITSWCNA